MIKKFEAFNEIDPWGEEKWGNEWLFQVRCESNAKLSPEIDKDNLKSTIEYTLRSLYDPNTPNGESQENARKTAFEQFPGNEIVEFQYNKMHEIFKKTGEKTIIEITDDELILSVEYTIELPGLEYEDVKDWVLCDGFGQLLTVFLYNEMMKYKVRNKQYNEILLILTEIRRNNRALIN